LATGYARVRSIVGRLTSVFGAVTADPVFGLTFDDGPDQLNTPEVLEVLAARRARATFFVLVPRASKFVSILMEMLAAGHEIALHGGLHVDLRSSSPLRVIADINRARKELEQLIGREIRWFRPPYGTQGLFSYLVARASGMEVVAWTASPRDFFALELDQQVAVALGELGPGGIMLLHDGSPSAPERRRRLIERLLADAERSGLMPVTVGELLERGEAIRRPWLRGRAEALIEEVAPFQLVQ
jgi:peptidoglycan/xylan/chitin deacetylase (PgdA/CDA1 family)